MTLKVKVTSYIALCCNNYVIACEIPFSIFVLILILFNTGSILYTINKIIYTVEHLQDLA